ncbi:MAG: uracil-DNA glycosylase [Sulfobacillus sp.]|nr:uracil-DNA glycosylase [Sulfobacillus sp.]
MDFEARDLETIHEAIIHCRRCPRLVEWREKVAQTKVRRFRDEPYWGKPLPGFGDPHARLLIVGLAPAAHGGNRTGRMFTGDDSGDWLIDALYQNGLANQPVSRSIDDGLVLHETYLTAAVRCAPPDNRPTPAEARACASYLQAEWQWFNPRVVVALGRFALEAVRRLAEALGEETGPLTFRHGAEYDWSRPTHRTLLVSYHPSRQNTQTGRLTRDMLLTVMARARAILEESGAP